ncbi:MAG: hypothetical protein EOM80_07455 [Erysipelotrichia bacterium]|nr:hypothetical protein [Erysipelotrichia bacterium]
MLRFRYAAMMLILVIIASFAAGCGSAAEDEAPMPDSLPADMAAGSSGGMALPMGAAANDAEIIEASPEDLEFMAEFGEDLTETKTSQNHPQNGELPPVGP